MGNGIVNNGGGGDGDDDDDDEWFDEEDDGDGDGDGFMRRAGPLPELFDRRTVECVLQEWFRTLSQLPTGLRMAVEMGLVSSAQVVRFMTMNTRPTVARQVSRCNRKERSVCTLAARAQRRQARTPLQWQMKAMQLASSVGAHVL